MHGYLLWVLTLTESLPTDTAVDVENCTDEEKLLLSSAVQSEDQQEFSLNNRSEWQQPTLNTLTLIEVIQFIQIFTHLKLVKGVKFTHIC